MPQPISKSRARHGNADVLCSFLDELGLAAFVPANHSDPMWAPSFFHHCYATPVLFASLPLDLRLDCLSDIRDLDLSLLLLVYSRGAPLVPSKATTNRGSKR